MPAGSGSHSINQADEATDAAGLADSTDGLSGRCNVGTAPGYSRPAAQGVEEGRQEWALHDNGGRCHLQDLLPVFL